MKRFLLLPMIFLIALASVNAQSSTHQNVKKFHRSSMGEIREGSDVKGYYYFWFTDEVDKKTNEYNLNISDNNLKTLKNVKIVGSKNVQVLESAFNGTDLIILLYDAKAKTFEYQVYGADGNKKPYTYNRELSNKEKRLLAMYDKYVDDDDQTYRGLYPIEGKGFISNMPSREDKDYTFQIDYFSTEKRKQWTYIPTEGGKKFVGDYLGSFNGVVYIEMLRFGSLMDQKPESSIIGLDLETGRQIFERATDSKYRFYPASLSLLNDGKAYIYGEYFDQNANIAKDKSLGFAFWGIDEKGKIISEKYCSWSVDMGKYLDVSSKGKIDDFGYMYLHNILQASDGSIYAIGEGYKKVASALGIASKFLSSGGNTASAIKIRVTDMIMIKFDQNFNVKEAKIYEKNSNSIELPGGYEFVSGPLLGKMIKYNYGGFDYEYMQTNKDVSSFTVCYSDYVRGKDYKGATFNSISYNEGKITTDKINTSKANIRYRIYPNKQGHVVIVEYNKKEKTIYSHVEKLN